ncbi:TAXI family TRAP transporter solute-binding subunit [Rhodobacterales bacterium]|nr:TAXI family TRAP transporter solute-binding subunit [Rhodobacterales bacterium]
MGVFAAEADTLSRKFRGLFAPLKKAANAAALLVLTGFHLSGSPANAADQTFITIGTAGVTGVYYPAGSAACQILNENRKLHGVRCSAETTLGSIENLAKLKSGDFEFAFVQSDWQHHAFTGSSVFEGEGPDAKLRSVLALHAEVATIVVREGSDFRALDDLKGARVNIGSSGSGADASWQVLTSELGWTDDDNAHVEDLNPSELADALCTDRIDAYFMLIGHPAGLIDETLEKCDIRILGFEEDQLEDVFGKSPFYTKAEIPAGLYGLSEPVASYGVVATLVTSEDVPQEIVYTLVQAVYDHFDSFKSLHPALSALEADDLVGDRMAAPLHPGALKFFSEKGLLPSR